ncbi:sulfate ABC transporter substrate-binding protein [Synechococcus sp. Cruz-9H2]|nr:sulfate ABC transporter substrate-binding protein [Synechococcus sp. Cruz-9H2]MCP9844608.1 sulfate ABC transporter substrate-binding protein [Synechococcus sp. Edmonson 11F2]MCP9856730.1 sulfate ABC transporter substrate-binding protein [Synechococcus sp. Cruz-9C9]MCP9864060.1 sulfate ABC transporter substrate-binding protein [Synechococcus sp. Cruz-7E5]MCP9871255.1 sulfate ABC transporter substrate-binding protein [Synechococcus sp. Cruz-7B9]
MLAAGSLVLLAGCGGPPQSSGTGDPDGQQQLLLVSYAVTKGAYDRIIPKFISEWKAKTGQELEIKTSYGGSGTQTRAVIDGLDADVVTLALSADVLKLEESGLLDAGWEKELPNNSIITNSTVAFLTRPGNPKQIASWADLIKPGITVVTANPKTSGGARWNFLGLWGSVTQTGGNQQQAEAYVASVYKNVDNLPKDAREASDVFLKKGQGDVLLNYENEAILATRTGDLKDPFLVPEVNIRIEGPVAVVDKNVERKGTRKAAEALAQYLFSEEAQAIFAEEGFRPTNPTIWSRVKDRFAPVKQFFTVQDFGGWDLVNKEFFGKDGLWDRLFAKTR